MTDPPAPPRATDQQPIAQGDVVSMPFSVVRGKVGIWKCSVVSDQYIVSVNKMGKASRRRSLSPFVIFVTLLTVGFSGLIHRTMTATTSQWFSVV